MQNSLRANALRYVGYPSILFAIALLLLYATNADLLLADAIYAFGDKGWVFRNAWLTNALIHDGGRTLVGVIAVALLTAIVLSLFHRPLARWRASLRQRRLLLAGAVLCRAQNGPALATAGGAGAADPRARLRRCPAMAGRALPVP